MKKFALLLCLSLFAMPAYSADWTTIDDDIDIDMQSIQKRYVKGKAYVGAWTRIVENGKTKAQNLRWYNCKDKTMSYLPSSSMTFDRFGRLNVNDTQQRQLADLQFVDIPPDTVTEMVYDVACVTSLMQDVHNGKVDESLFDEYHDSHFANFSNYMLSQFQ